MKIAWFSRHAPTSRQLASLRTTFNTLKITMDTRAFDSAELIAARYRASGADDLVIVAPLSVVQALVQRGIHPIWAQMECVAQTHPEAEVRIKSRIGRIRYYRFIRFWRIRDVKLDLVPLTVPSAQKADARCLQPPLERPAPPSSGLTPDVGGKPVLV